MRIRLARLILPDYYSQLIAEALSDYGLVLHERRRFYQSRSNLGILTQHFDYLYDICHTLSDGFRVVETNKGDKYLKEEAERHSNEY